MTEFTDPATISDEKASCLFSQSIVKQPEGLKLFLKSCSSILTSSSPTQAAGRHSPQVDHTVPNTNRKIQAPPPPQPGSASLALMDEQASNLSHSDGCSPFPVERLGWGKGRGEGQEGGRAPMKPETRVRLPRRCSMFTISDAGSPLYR